MGPSWVSDDLQRAGAGQCTFSIQKCGGIMAQVQPPRQINSDGTVTVRCRECGKDICRMIYRGFLSSVCEECSTGRVSPYSNLPEPMDHAPLYNTVEEDAD